MAEVKLKFDGREMTLRQGVTTVGRTPDNDISFPSDSNVSRYHAEIESRGGEFCLIDLNSSNGTTVNGLKVLGEKYLKEGDVIVLGGTSTIEFGGANEPKAESQTEAAKPEAEADASFAMPNTPSVAVPPVSGLAASAGGAAAAAPPVASGSNTMLMIAGGACLLAVVFVVAAGAIYYASTTSCDAKAVITKPEPGDTIIEPTEIEVDVEDAACVAKASFTIDGVEFFRTTEQPFTATIDPKEFPDLSDGFDHNLGIVLIDEDGNPIPQPGAVALAFETREIKKPEPGPEVANTSKETAPTGPKGKAPSLIEIQQMSTRLTKQFSGGRTYNLSNKQFLQEVQKKTGEFAQEGYFEKAAKYRDAINVAFVREQNLDAPLGYMLAMSRSKFNPDKQGTNEGLWKMDSAFVTANSYNGLCGTEPLSDPSQNCAAKATALYMKSMVYGVFDGDIIYSAAAFGKSPQDAGVWNATLPAKREDIWNVIKTAPEREQLVNFFAAGIVAENPQKFGLKKDRPLSELYRLAM